MTRQDGPMDKAIEQIVDAYVRLQNRKALEDLRTHRQRLLSDLKGRSDSVYDVSGAMLVWFGPRRPFARGELVQFWRRLWFVLLLHHHMPGGFMRLAQ
jgi:hypothetical protein